MDSDKIQALLLWGAIVIGVMWIGKWGPFSKNDASVNAGGGSYPVTFGGGSYTLRTIRAFHRNGDPAGKYEIVQKGDFQYAHKEGWTQEFLITEDYQNGFNYSFWNGAEYLFFY